MRYVLMSLMVLLTGCVKEPEVNTIIQTKTEYLPLPDYYLEDCKIPVPPNKEKYLKLSAHEKEKQLAELYLEAVYYNDQCNTRLGSARAYQEKIKNIYKTESSENDTSDSGSLFKNYTQ